MKNAIFILLLFCFSQHASAQEKSKVLHEFGGKAFVMYLNLASAQSKGNTLLEHELFYRIHWEKNAVRAMFSSWNKRKELYVFGVERFFPPMTIIQPKEIFASIGYQHSGQGKLKNLYVFTDIHYTQFECSGLFLSPVPMPYSAKAVRVGLEQGVGYKLQVFGCVNICPEVFFNFVSSTIRIQLSDANNKVVGALRNGSIKFLPSARLFLSFELKDLKN